MHIFLALVIGVYSNLTIIHYNKRAHCNTLKYTYVLRANKLLKLF